MLGQSALSTIFFVIIVLTTSATASPGVVLLKRTKRGMGELKELIEDATQRRWTDWYRYGNWCGFGGSGGCVDALDDCCFMHDICYDSAIAECGQSAIRLTGYRYESVDDRKFVRRRSSPGANPPPLFRCRDRVSSCAFYACHCDAALARCLRRSLADYKLKYRVGSFRTERKCPRQQNVMTTLIDEYGADVTWSTESEVASTESVLPASNETSVSATGSSNDVELVEFAKMARRRHRRP